MREAGDKGLSGVLALSRRQERHPRRVGELGRTRAGLLSDEPAVLLIKCQLQEVSECRGMLSAALIPAPTCADLA